jgi:outer membrane receptor protein involved in Fe transport
MNKNRILNTLLATTFIGGAIGIATPAFAQDNPGTQGGTTGQPQTGPVEASTPTTSADANPAAAQDQGAIVITGSRIPQPNLTAVSPVTVVNSQEVKLQGTSRTEDLINSLPQAFAEQGGNLANGATGTATVNLRGLGSNRTLVLINGRRLLPGDPSFPSPDINIVPASIIDRVDVLTGGASSVYGADAVSGVVNFIMDTKFEGIKLDGQYSFYNHDNGTKTGLIDALNRRGFGYPHGVVSDGGTIDLSGQIGASFDDGRGHVVAYATYRKLNQITEAKRDYSACTSQARATSTVIDCGGSATAANGTIIAYTGTPNPDPKKSTFTSTFFQIGPNRTLIPGFTPFNFAPYNYYQRPDERYTFGAFADYEISPALHPYMEAMFMDDRTVAQIAPSGDFGNTFAVNCDNPLLSAQQRSILCAPNNLLSNPDGTVVGQTVTAGNPGGAPPFAFIDPTTGQPYFKGFAQILRRNVEGGGRQDDLQHTTYRIVGGMRGELSNVWSYDAYYQYGRVNFSETYLNDFSVTRLTRALDVVNIGGVPTCRSVRDGSDPNCVPYDIFGGTPSAAALNYLQTPGFQRGQVEQAVASVSITGKLGEYGLRFPWAEDGIGIALGAEYRKDLLNLATDEEFQTGDLAGQGAPTLPAHGAFDVRELFGEIRIPIVENGFFKSLAVEAGYRRSSYELKGGVGHGFKTDTWKLGLDFAPVKDLRIRASYNRAVRAPNIQELFATQRVALNGNADPCAKTITAADKGCLLQGLVVGQTVAGNPAGQYNGLIGGNPNLVPEVATSKTVGIVFQPRFVPRLALTVDWFDIKVKKAIQQIGQDTILDVCNQTLDPKFCGLVHRDQFGSIWRTGNGYVIDTTQNVGGVSTRGIDVGFSYAMDIGSLGGLSLNAVGTWLDKLITDSGVGDAFDCAGLYGLRCGTPNPTWRHKVRLTWTAPDGIGLSAQWRYFKGVEVDRSSSQPTLKAAFSPFNAKIPAQNYFDLALTARIGDHYNFRLGVNNILDRDPPIIGSNGASGVINACPSVYCSGNTFPNVYDALGRYIFAGVTLDF